MANPPNPEPPWMTKLAAHCYLWYPSCRLCWLTNTNTGTITPTFNALRLVGATHDTLHLSCCSPLCRLTNSAGHLDFSPLNLVLLQPCSDLPKLPIWICPVSPVFRSSASFHQLSHPLIHSLCHQCYCHALSSQLHHIWYPRSVGHLCVINWALPCGANNDNNTRDLTWF